MHGWTRRDALKATAGAALASLFACGDDASPIGGPRNLILITGDDLGWKDLSASGNPNLATPNLDRIASAGVSFRNAFDVTSSCSSSRATFATGQYPQTHGVVGLVHRFPELSLPEGTPTLASHLRAAGFVTAIEGKFHIAFPQTADAYGYQEVMTSLLAQRIEDSSQTIAFIERMASRRFFLELNYMNPHRDLGGDFAQHPDHPIDPAALELPAYARLPDVEGCRLELAAYYSQVQRMDAMIGEVLDALEARRLLDDTLIAFVSDNGMPFPGNKCNLYDRGTGTPLLFSWPAGIPAGVVRDDLVSTVDVMPTLLELAGITVPAEVEGQSLLPLLVDPVATREGVVFSEMTQHHLPAPFPMRSIRTARFRYIRNYNDRPAVIEGDDQAWVQEVLASDLAGYRWTARRVPEELYDLAADPTEQTNLVADPGSLAVLADLRQALDAHMAATRDSLLGAPFELVEP